MSTAHLSRTGTRPSWGWLVAAPLVVAVSCLDFDTALDACVEEDRCAPTEGCRAMADEPDDAFQDTNCDGIDGTAYGVLFVDPVSGQDTQPGTRRAPLRSLGRALELARQGGHRAIYLAQGTYNETGLTMERAVSLYGGYGRSEDGGWTRSSLSTAHLDGGSIALTLYELGEDAGVVLERLLISSAPGEQPGRPSIGLRVVRSSGVQLRRVEVRAGAGADGADGGAPPPATDGARGEDGTGGDAGIFSGQGGRPGTTFCTTQQSSGGAGGQGAPGVDGGLATDGTTVDGGGIGGKAGRNDDSSNDYNIDVDAGDNGGPGTPGQRGLDGAGGDGTGRLEGDVWVPNSGASGGQGENGRGGGGGGGGGQTKSQYYPDYAPGGGGGGGGGGGCGGMGGEGGGGGGASIGLLLIRSQVALERSTIVSTQGGRGGTGAPGSAGGLGGMGGASGQGSYTEYFGAHGNRRARGGTGGAGGPGGQGGQGGAGGSGGGGPSMGVWCGPDSSFTKSSDGLVDIRPGAAGLGGVGMGKVGEPGAQRDAHGCF